MSLRHKFARLRNAADLPAYLKGAAVAIGNFDGAHLGHQKVLNAALAQARGRGAPALVFTFEPHPRNLFKPAAPVHRLTSAAQKAAYFQALGFDGVIEQDFTAAFAALSAEDFIRQIIAGALAARCVVAGANFHFGHKRRGTPAFLRQAGQEYGFAVKLVDGKPDETGALISSSRIRALLEAGEMRQANRLLGHNYTAEGKIIRGRQLGRTLGFPTANMELPPETQLKYGIYAVYFTVGGQRFKGVASFGRRPTVELCGKPLLETFIFDFSGDIYGQSAAVEFVCFLRGEEKFGSAAELAEQMQKDAAAAKRCL